ncbi:protein canopy homolog 3 isoform X1 [Harpia harpyja]|uniref:protein canopy homolog 3 isoform X1 n=1 Tax=Harpia harpyja TaxID=202280 RepID=UPI0022B12471|nr:protein canopy homolog 3 isoform X1 [Harpia harpyja]
MEVLLAVALLLLLPPGRATGPLPTLAPPLSMMVAGQRRRLVVCVVSDLAPGSGHAVWISGGNGSTLQSFTYGASQEDGGTVCTVSLLPDDPPAEGDLACHVGPNTTSPAHSSSPIRVTGTAPQPPFLPVLLAPRCPSGPRGWGPAGSRCEVPLPRPTSLPTSGRAGRGLRPALPHTWHRVAAVASPAALSSRRRRRSGRAVSQQHSCAAGPRLGSPARGRPRGAPESRALRRSSHLRPPGPELRVPGRRPTPEGEVRSLAAKKKGRNETPQLCAKLFLPGKRLWRR